MTLGTFSFWVSRARLSTCLLFNFRLPKLTISSLKSSCSKIHFMILCCLILTKLAHSCNEPTTTAMNVFAANLKDGGCELTQNFPTITFLGHESLTRPANVQKHLTGFNPLKIITIYILCKCKILIIIIYNNYTLYITKS